MCLYRRRGPCAVPSSAHASRCAGKLMPRAASWARSGGLHASWRISPCAYARAASGASGGGSPARLRRLLDTLAEGAQRARPETADDTVTEVLQHVLKLARDDPATLFPILEHRHWARVEALLRSRPVHARPGDVALAVGIYAQLRAPVGSFGDDLLAELAQGITGEDVDCPHRHPLRGWRPSELASAAWAFATMARAPRGQGLIRGSPFSAKACQALVSEAARRPPASLSARNVANLMWVAAKMELPVAANELLRSLGKPGSGAGRLAFKAQEASNMLWAVATLQTPLTSPPPGEEILELRSLRGMLQAADAKLASSLTAMHDPDGVGTKASDGQLKAQHIANSLWAFARLCGGSCDTDLVRAVQRTASSLPRLISGDTRSLVSIAVAWVKLSQPGGGNLLRGLATEALQQLSSAPRRFDEQGLANLAWALAAGTLEGDGSGTADVAAALQAIAEEVAGRARRHGGLPTATPQQLSSLSWSLARGSSAVGGEGRCQAFAAIRREALVRLHEFEEQGLSNIAWAFARVGWDEAAGQDGFPEAIARQVVRTIRVPEPQHIANLAWALSRLSVTAVGPARGFWHWCTRAIAGGASAERTALLLRLQTQELSGLAGGLALAGAMKDIEARSIAAVATAHLTGAGAESLCAASSLLWAFAVAGFQHAPLFGAVEAVANAAMNSSTVAASIDGRRSLLGLSWAAAFIGDAGFAGSLTQRVRITLEDAGRILDLRQRSSSAVSTSTRALGDVSAALQPVVVADFGGAYALLKPPDWEVDASLESLVGGSSRTGQRPRLLSEFLRRQWPSSPIVTDQLHDLGVIHRLDTNSSGLILGAKTYEAYFKLHFALHTYQVQREYVVLCHGVVDPRLTTINARVVVRGRTSHVFEHAAGSPAITHLKVLAHFRRKGLRADGVAEPSPYGEFTLVVLSIHTGRHHQIRVHLQAMGHPTVCDARYAGESFLADRKWCPRNFLHRFRLAGIPGMGKAEEESSVSVGLPADLCRVLSDELEPAGAASAAAAAVWCRDGAPPSFESLAALPPCDGGVPAAVHRFRNSAWQKRVL